MTKTENPEIVITNLLTHTDPTVLQLATPILMMEDWDADTVLNLLKIKEEETKKEGHKIKIYARATALFSVARLLMDVAPSLGMPDRPITKRKLKKIIDTINKEDHNMEGDEWQSEYAPLPGTEGEDTHGSSYTDIFFLTTNWRTVWSLCDFLREIEVHKTHKYY